MKSSKKANKIYTLLRNSILKRKLSPGMLLPRETEFAAEFGVSRDTIRKALSLLESEHLVRRVRGHGTYVNDALPKRKISFMLPCSEIFRIGRYFVPGFLQGIQEACRLLNCELETIAVSPTNDRFDIDWKQLFNLNRDSLVVVYGLWFQRIFPFLLATGCRVVLILEQLKFYPKDLGKFLSQPGWSSFFQDRSDEGRRMIQHTFDQGGRRPGFLLPYIDRPENMMPDVLRQACKEIFPGYTPPLTPVEDQTPVSEIRIHIEKLLKEEKCDSLIITTENSLTAVRKYFPDLLCGFLHRNSMREFSGGSRTFYSQFDFVKIGHEAVVQLLRNDDSRKEQKYQCKITEYHPETAEHFI